MEVEHAAVVILGPQEVGSLALDAFLGVDARLGEPGGAGGVEVGPEHGGNMLAAGHVEHRSAGHGPRDERGQVTGEFGADVLPGGLAVLRLAGFEQDVGPLGVQHER
ncbi:MAG: hypothetical protein AAFR38_02855 [Planctomycetota bacterium]